MVGLWGNAPASSNAFVHPSNNPLWCEICVHLCPSVVEQNCFGMALACIVAARQYWGNRSGLHSKKRGPQPRFGPRLVPRSQRSGFTFEFQRFAESRAFSRVAGFPTRCAPGRRAVRNRSSDRDRSLGRSAPDSRPRSKGPPKALRLPTSPVSPPAARRDGARSAAGLRTATSPSVATLRVTDPRSASKTKARQALCRFFAFESGIFA